MMRIARRLLALGATVAVASAVAALASLAPASPLAQSCAAAGSHHAALVVEHGDGSVTSRCVAFETASVTGEALLNSSGVAWSGQTFGTFGAAVCSLGGEPAHYSTCPGKDYYWAVFVSRGGGAWQLADAGVSSLTLGDGDAEGFRYVPAAGTPAAPPSPAGVCAATTATATATATAGAGHTVATTITAASGAAATPGSGAAAATDSAAPVQVAGATAAGPGSSATGVAGSHSAVVPLPGPGSGPDLGLLAAAVAGGGLAGLVLLRLAAGRRRSARA